MSMFKIGDRVQLANGSIGHVEEIYDTDPRIYIVRIDKETKYKAIEDHLILLPEEIEDSVTITRKELEDVLKD